MRAVLTATLTALALSCGGARLNVEPEKIPTPSMTLIGRDAMAHACPIPGYIITAAHVAQEVRPIGPPEFRGYVWQQQHRRGFAEGTYALFHRDLGILEVRYGDDPVPHPVALAFPAPGSEVYWYEFDYTRGLTVVRREGVVLSLVAGHLSFEPAPKQGSSGGCLFNEQGEVVGIVTWGMYSEDSADGTGLAPTIVGEYGPPPKE